MNDSETYLSDLRWCPADVQVADALTRVFRGWTGTPYMRGVRCRGAGVDCVQLVFGVYDHLYKNSTPTPCPRLHWNSATHNARSGFKTVAAFRKGFPTKVVRDGTIEPGDLVLCRANLRHGGPRRPGHAMIVAPSFGHAFHSTSGIGASMVGFSTIPILRIYRLLNKQAWVQ